MRDWQSQSHVRRYCRYHIVIVPKYRRKAIYGVLRKEIGRILKELRGQFGVELVEGYAMSDHVHMCLSIPPKLSVAYTIGRLKMRASMNSLFLPRLSRWSSPCPAALMRPETSAPEVSITPTRLPQRALRFECTSCCTSKFIPSIPTTGFEADMDSVLTAPEIRKMREDRIEKVVFRNTSFFMIATSQE